MHHHFIHLVNGDQGTLMANMAFLPAPGPCFWAWFVLPGWFVVRLVL